jgi:GNAT superfamily N-acetyltransferase
MIEIIDYRPEHQPWFEALNREWIERDFWIEPIDLEVLQHPEKHILSPGGSILMATENREIAGTVALKRVNDHVFEFTKMAVDQKFRGRKIGLALGEAALQRAKRLGALKVVLYSSTKLAPAISLYKKLGFVEVPVDGPYKRSDIKMELTIGDEIIVRPAGLSDVPILSTLGASTFSDAFAPFNTEEDIDDYLNRNFSRAQVELELKTAGTVFLLATHRDNVLGYAKLRTQEVPEVLAGTRAIELERIYAVKDQWGKSIGKWLMKACLDVAQKRGFEAIWLGVWELNSRAIAFYEKWGFEKFGSHAFLLGKDLQTDLLMKRDLNPVAGSLAENSIQKKTK